jgi:hypothetical protein
MILPAFETCACGEKVCKRCGQCHNPLCEDQVGTCRSAFVQSRVGKTRVLHHRRAKQFGVYRRLRSA